MTSRFVLACDALQALHRTISGVTAPAMAQYRTVIDTPDLPYVMTWPTAGSSHIKGGGYRTDARTMRIFCFVQAVNQDDIPSRVLDAVAYLDRITALYLTPINIGLLDPDDAASEGYQMTIESGPGRPIPDSGIRADLVFGGREFVGFTVDLPVRILWGAGAVGS